MTGFGQRLFRRESADLQVTKLGGVLDGEHGARMK